jgi:hypothetical protein
MKRFLVPGLPFLLSLVLSGCTVGQDVGWQDSGFFLAGVKELGILYPHGFVLYLVLCKLWTLFFGFVRFTLAVHLFSSVCAAGAAGAIALASRDFLRAEGPLFRVPAAQGDLPAIVAGCLAASGFTFWSAALLAKGYALLYLILALLLWRMIRADETGKGRDFSIVAVLVGLAWAAHPSASTLGPALVLFAAAQGRRLGLRGVAGRVGIAAACALGPSLLLPLLARRDPATMFGNPSSFGPWIYYLAGGAFTHREGTFGFVSWRAVNAVRYFWEEFLGIGLALALFGLSRLAVVNRKLLLGMAAWILPSALVATLFKIEGQQDLWLVSAWLPLYLAVALALASLPARSARVATLGIGVAGLSWAVAANGRAVSMRDYTLADQFGHFYLHQLDRDSILLLESDDALATTRYLQVVKGFRTDVFLVDAARLGSGWYDEHLRKQDARLKPAADARSFALANVARGRAVYFESAPLPELPGLSPAGPLWRLAASGEANEPQVWAFPVLPALARMRMGRPRGIRRRGTDVEPEAYEQRWISAFVRAEDQQARMAFKKGDYRRAAERFESARAADPDHPDPELIHLLGVSHYLLGEYDRAEPFLRQSLRLGPTPRQSVRALAYLSTICQKQGRSSEALRCQQQAMTIVGADPELRREFEQFPRPR